MCKPAWLILLLLLPVNDMVKIYSFQHNRSFGENGRQLNVNALHPALAAVHQKKELNTDSLKRTDWYEQVIKNITASEYDINAKDDRTYTSPNINQQFDLSFTSDRFIIRPEEKHDWELQLSFDGIYANNKKIYSGDPHSPALINGNKIVFSHKDEFRIEYINGREGVRQNFILLKAPNANVHDMVLKLSVNNGWVSELVHQKEIHFSRWNKQVLENKVTYNSLKVWDANEKELDASFIADRDGISIHVNTTGAEYPITIDPLSSTPVQSLSGTASSYFGNSVSGAGDVNGDGYSDIIIGAYNVTSATGIIYLFTGSATGISASPATTINGENTGDKFGFSVGTAGDVNNDGYSDVIVGAPGYSSNQGRAYVFLGSSTGLNTTAASTLNGNAAGDQFGYSTAGAGDVNADGNSDVIVGAYGVSSETGSAMVYHGNSTGVNTSPITTLNGQSIGDRFGYSVAAAGNVNGDAYSDVIVGAYKRNSLAGAAYVYIGSAAGINSTINTTLSGITAGDLFGFCVAAAGDVNGDGYTDVIVGAYGVSSAKGAAYIYAGNAGGVSTSPTILSGTISNGWFGCGVACAGDINSDGYADVIIGEPAASTSTGNFYIFQGSASGLPTSPTISRPGIAISSSFGFSVASAGDINGDGFSDLIVGAPNQSVNTGAAFTYHGSSDGLNTNFAWSLESNQAGANMAFHISGIASAGDVNGDGYSDVLIGIPNYSGAFSGAGRVLLFKGSASGLSSTPDWTADGTQPSAQFGFCVSYAGDVNGDGYGDVIIGAPNYNGGQAGEGRIYVYFGSPVSLLSASPDWFVESDQNNANLGFSVSSAGDVNGDGYGDVIASAPLYNNGVASEGIVNVYYGSGAGLNTTPAWSVSSGQSNSYFGHSVAGIGDVNGDGFSDVAIGAHMFDEGNSDEGKVFVYYGSWTGLPSSPNWTNQIDMDNANYGVRVASAGDVNGDGFADLIVGAHGYSNGETNEGKAFVYYGSITGLSVSSNWAVESNSIGARFGIVSSAGDVNGDGYSDVQVGAFSYTNGQSNEGAVFVFYGSSTGLSTSAGLTLESNYANAWFGYSVACAGDVNGDGYSDILVGAPFYTNVENNEGASFLYMGNKTGGKRNNLLLYNSDLVTPISQANMNEPNLFGAGLFSNSFLGSQKGKLVWQTVKNGNPFPGVPITNNVGYTAQQSSYTSLGLSGTELKNQVAKQIGNTKATYIRARVKYDPVTAITGQVYGPWRYPEGFLRGKRDIGSVALPVKFLAFTVEKQGEKCLLTWTTENETPGISYRVQRSPDGRNYSTLAVVTGNNFEHNIYQWPDLQPYKGLNYYRICAVETGKSSYSEIRRIIFREDYSMSLYPNPARAGKQAIIRSGVFETGRLYFLSLTDLAGRTAFKKQVLCKIKGSLDLGLPGLSSGDYLVIIESEGKRWGLKISVIGDH